MQFGSVKEIALQPPGLVQFLFPLLARVDAQRPAGEIDLGLLRVIVFWRGSGTGLDAHKPVFGLIDQDFVIQRNSVSLHLGRDG